jgi:hypothetical protein
VRALGEAGQFLGQTVNDIVPPEAQVHLFNAQRELLLAIKATAEFHLRNQEEREERARRRRPIRVELE